MFDRYQIQPERPVELATLKGPPIAARLLEVRVDDEPGARVVAAVLELTGEAYARARREGQLGLDAPGRGPGPEPEPDRPVRIDVRLRQALADALESTPDPMASLLRELLETPAPLAHADAWRATAVTQQDPDEPALSIGYRTGWASAAGRMVDEIVVAALDRMALAHEILGDGLVRATPAPGAALPWTLLIHTAPPHEVLAVYGVLAATVRSDLHARAALELARMTVNLPAGGFDLDPEDGEIRFRIDRLSDATTIAQEAVERMIGYAIEVIEDHAPELAALLEIR